MQKSVIDSTFPHKRIPLQGSPIRHHGQIEPLVGRKPRGRPTRRPSTPLNVSNQARASASRPAAGRLISPGPSHNVSVRVERLPVPDPRRYNQSKTSEPDLSGQHGHSPRLSSVKCSSTVRGRGEAGPSEPRNSPAGRSTIPRNISSNSKDGSQPPSTRKGPAVDKPIVGFSIGIETEFVLSERFRQMRYRNTFDFLQIMVAIHNGKAPEGYPQMEAQMDYYEDSRPRKSGFKRWVVIEEPSVLKVKDKPGKYGVEMKTPKFRISQTSNWKDQVKATWAFVHQNYIVSKTTQCSTHVHISAMRGGEGGGGIGIGLQNLKKIAQCIIHFEPALEALVPKDRRGNLYACSNWIDNRWFANPYMTRNEVIDIIGRCNSQTDLIMLMCPKPQKRNFAWNFHALNKFGTIEFRKGGASLKGDEAIAWAELVLLFVQSAVQIDRESLRTMPANIRGLKGFLGVNRLRDLKPLLDGKDQEEVVEPQIVLSRNEEETEVLRKKLRDDAAEQLKLAKAWSQRD